MAWHSAALCDPHVNGRYECIVELDTDDGHVILHRVLDWEASGWVGPTDGVITMWKPFPVGPTVSRCSVCKWPRDFCHCEVVKGG